MRNNLSWSFLLRWTTRGLTFVRIAIIARILTSEQLGVFAIATLVLAFLEIITETWINVFLIQEKGNIDKFVDTAWVISIFRGFIISLIIVISSPFVTDFFNSSAAAGVLILLSLVPLIRGLINPSIVYIQKELEFKKEFFYKYFLFLIEMIAIVILAFVWRSSLSLVAGMIIAAIIEVILSFAMCRPWPKFSFNPQIFRNITKRGKWVTVAGLCNYLYQNGDNIAVGRLLGASQLGIYDYAYKLSSLPVSEIGDVVARVAFPTYVKKANDLKSLISTYQKSLFLVGVTALSISLVLFFGAETIVNILLGDQWLATIPVIKILAIYGFAKAIIGTFFPVFLSLKKQAYVVLTTLSLVFGLGITVLPLTQRHGVTGTAMSAVVGSVLALPVGAVLLVLTFNQQKKKL